jgi:hypothetical protein
MKDARWRGLTAKSWVGVDSRATISVELIANMEEQLEEEKKTGTMIHMMNSTLMMKILMNIQ